MSRLKKTFKHLNTRKISLILFGILLFCGYTEGKIKELIDVSEKGNSTNEAISGYSVLTYEIPEIEQPSVELDTSANPIVTMPSTPPESIEPETCITDWSCTEWSECLSPGTKTRDCIDLNSCKTNEDKPVESKECTYAPPCLIACNSNSDCNDNDPCTDDVCNNAGSCDAYCSNYGITSATSGDGCCPAGLFFEDDNDCSDCSPGKIWFNQECITPVCETDSDCDDQNACTTDTCINPTTCEHTAITTPLNDDLCCPTEYYLDEDNDCSECSPGKVLYNGTCVVPMCTMDLDCEDNNACTIDTCTNPWAWNALCEYIVITEPINDDLCCPEGYFLDDDNDCSECSPGKLLCDNECVTPACNQNSDCDDGKRRTRDECVNPNTCDSFCLNTKIKRTR